LKPSERVQMASIVAIRSPSELLSKVSPTDVCYVSGDAELHLGCMEIKLIRLFYSSSVFAGLWTQNVYVSLTVAANLIIH
jgi:hypothetical protein